MMTSERIQEALANSLRGTKEAIAVLEDTVSAHSIHLQVMRGVYTRSFFEQLAFRITKGILVSGFENAADAEKVLLGQQSHIADTLENAFRGNETGKTNPAEEKCQAEKSKCEAIDRGELVELLKRYRTHCKNWSVNEYAETVADAIIRLGR